MAEVQPAAFLSYSHFDDQHDNGYLTKLHKRLSDEVRAQTGEEFDIFQDRKDIKWGQQWKARIDEAIDATTFLIPVITPSYFTSQACRDELTHFLRVEARLGRHDLILPIYYIAYPQIENADQRKQDPLAQEIAKRQYFDWRSLRGQRFSSRRVNDAIAKLATSIRDALRSRPARSDPPVTPVQPPSQPHYLSVQEADNRAEARLDLRQARAAMDLGNLSSATTYTDHAISLCPDLEQEARTTLGLWMARAVIDSYINNPLRFARSMPPRFMPAGITFGTMPQLDTVPDAANTIQQLLRVLELASEDLEVETYLALMYAREGKYGDMMAAMKHAIADAPDMHDRLSIPDHLAVLANACCTELDPKQALRQIGELLGQGLPADPAFVQQTLLTFDLRHPAVMHNPNIDWYVVGVPDFWAELPRRSFVTSVRIQCVEEETQRRAHAFFLLPAPGSGVHIPSNATEGVNGDYYLSVDEIVSELARRFHFIAPIIPAHTPASRLGGSSSEVQRRREVMARLQQLYILSHDQISPGLAAGSEPLPNEWVKEQLEKMGERWQQGIYS